MCRHCLTIDNLKACNMNVFIKIGPNEYQSEKTFSVTVTNKELNNYTSYKFALCKTE